MIPLLPRKELQVIDLYPRKVLYLRSMFLHLLCQLPSCGLDTSPSSTQVTPPLDLH
ncbi:hypothetical protein GW17_00000782 [Ensete ventricosum]|nr:hypothetical protein GW17_00000782 [Ensete ventricosum]